MAEYVHSVEKLSKGEGKRTHKRMLRCGGGLTIKYARTHVGKHEYTKPFRVVEHRGQLNYLNSCATTKGILLSHYRHKTSNYGELITN